MPVPVKLTHARQAEIGAEPPAFSPFRNCNGVIATVLLVPAWACALEAACKPAVAQVRSPHKKVVESAVPLDAKFPLATKPVSPLAASSCPEVFRLLAS